MHNRLDEPDPDNPMLSPMAVERNLLDRAALVGGTKFAEELRRAFEQWFAPVARRLGWRPEFRWERLAQWAMRHGGVRLIERRAMPPLGHFSLIRFERAQSAPVPRAVSRPA